MAGHRRGAVARPASCLQLPADRRFVRARPHGAPLLHRGARPAAGQSFMLYMTAKRCEISARRTGARPRRSRPPPPPRNPARRPPGTTTPRSPRTRPGSCCTPNAPRRVPPPPCPTLSPTASHTVASMDAPPPLSRRNAKWASSTRRRPTGRRTPTCAQTPRQGAPVASAPWSPLFPLEPLFLSLCFGRPIRAPVCPRAAVRGGGRGVSD